MVLSSFGFVNTLSPPVNLSTDPRLINSMNFSPRFCNCFLKNGLHDRERWPKQQHSSHTSHPVSDGPILRFSPSSPPPQFASIADRSHSITYTKNGPSVQIFPMSTVLIDVDSFFAGNATLSFGTSRPGDIIAVDENVANGFGVVVVGSGTESVYLNGVASLAAYLEVQIRVFVVIFLSILVTRY